MKSLELNWIRKYDKALPLPDVCFAENLGYGGAYYEPWRGSQWFDNKRYENKNGLILVASDEEEDRIASIIAHEWRHHWQFHKGYVADGYWPETEDYEEFIYQYFTRSSTEFDALRFEYKFAKGECNDYWMGILFGDKNLTNHNY